MNTRETLAWIEQLLSKDRSAGAFRLALWKKRKELLGAMNDMCECASIVLGYYPVMREYRENRARAGLPANGIQIDMCIADQVIELWTAGVRTYGSCCGHKSCAGYINVDERDYQRALGLGFEAYVFEDDPERRDTVKTKGDE